MKPKNKLNYICVLPFLLSLAISGITGYDIAKQMDDKKKPIDMKADLDMTLINKKGKKRTSSIRSISRDGGKKQIVWFLSPADDKGVAFLKIEHQDKDDEMRMWLPAFKKVRRISSKKKSDSFMGSDMSYEDMANRELDENTYKLLREEIYNEQNCYVLEITPLPILNTAYSNHIAWISKDNLILLKEESFDKTGKLFKQKSLEYIKIKDYNTINKMIVRNTQKNHKTIIKFNNIELDSGVKKSLFQEKNLKRMPR